MWDALARSGVVKFVSKEGALRQARDLMRRDCGVRFVQGIPDPLGRHFAAFQGRQGTRPACVAVLIALRSGLSGRNAGLLRDAGRLAVPGARSIVGTGDIFGDRLTQPIHVPRRSVRLSKRHCDAGFVEGIEDGDP